MFRRLINSFGGGILLAITCFYLIPEVFENFSKLKDSTLAKSITPYPMLFICVGFFLFYLIKQIVYISIEPSNQLTAQLRTEQIIQSLMGYDPAEKFKAQVLVSAKGLMLVCSLSSNEFYEKVNWRYCATLGSQW